MQTTLDLLLARFGGQILVPFAEAARAAGMPVQTARNRLRSGIFPFQTVTVGRRRFAHVTDIAAYIDSVSTPGPKKGRPTKSESLSEKAAGGRK